MATFTSAQLLSLLDALSESKLTSKQFAKKVVKMKKVLDKGGDFDKVIDGCRSTKPKSKAGAKKPPSAWDLFVADYRKENAESLVGKNALSVASPIWKAMSVEAKQPFVDEAKALKDAQNSSDEESVETVEVPLKDSIEDSVEETSDLSEDSDEAPIQKVKKPRAGKEKVDFEFFGDLDSLDWETLNLEDEKSSKFWRIVTKDEKVLINYGKQGAKGTFQQKTFESSEKAEDFNQKEIASKLKKNYIQ